MGGMWVNSEVLDICRDWSCVVLYGCYEEFVDSGGVVCGLLVLFGFMLYW